MVLELFQLVGFAAHWALALLSLVEFLLALVVVFSGEAYHCEVAQGAFLQAHIGYVEIYAEESYFLCPPAPLVCGGGHGYSFFIRSWVKVA